MGAPSFPPAAKVRGFMMEPSDLRDIGKILSTNIATKQDLMIACEIAAQISVDGIDIRLEPRLLQRLKSRCIGNRLFSEFLKETVVKGLHDFAGW